MSFATLTATEFLFFRKYGDAPGKRQLDLMMVAGNLRVYSAVELYLTSIGNSSVRLVLAILVISGPCGFLPSLLIFVSGPGESMGPASCACSSQVRTQLEDYSCAWRAPILPSHACCRKRK